MKQATHFAAEALDAATKVKTLLAKLPDAIASEEGLDSVINHYSKYESKIESGQPTDTALDKYCVASYCAPFQELAEHRDVVLHGRILESSNGVEVLDHEIAVRLRKVSNEDESDTLATIWHLFRHEHFAPDPQYRLH